ncbi:CLUMA_CG015476, isoform A [Clunio marinus]|uniref:CLUMA_CG015476, isoform A n=1 Tax=Clunio marinus TaxID=568069 RepID=A0A1J1ISN8_9DIPT|nr:CLUMA_CG015476, isoform A [Clunio marinus]
MINEAVDDVNFNIFLWNYLSSSFNIYVSMVMIQSVEYPEVFLRNYEHFCRRRLLWFLGIKQIEFSYLEASKELSFIFDDEIRRVTVEICIFQTNDKAQNQLWVVSLIFMRKQEEK